MARQKRLSRSKQAHEAKCRRCGRCCRDKYLIDDRMFFAAQGECKHFDPQTKRCTIYYERHDVNPQCLSVKRGIELGVFPADCPYVKDRADYVPPVEIGIDDKTMRLIETGQITNPKDLEAHLNMLAQKQKAKRRRGE